MSALSENALTKLATESSVDLNSTGTTSLYEVPQGKTARITHVLFRDVSADTANLDIEIGDSSTTDNWCKRVLLGQHMDAAQESYLLRARNYLQGSATWDPGNITGGAEEAKDVTVNDAELGDFAIASFSLDVTDLVLDVQVTAADTVTCVLANNTGGAIDLGSGTVRVRVFKFNGAWPEYSAGDVLTLKVNTAVGGACTANIDVFGILA